MKIPKTKLSEIGVFTVSLGYSHVELLENFNTSYSKVECGTPLNSN